MSTDTSSKSLADSVTVGQNGPGALSVAAIIMAVAGGALCIMALASKTGREAFGFAYLWGFTFVWVLVLGSLFIVALHHATGAVWSVVIRRVAEMFAAPMWIVGIFFIPVLILCFWHDIPLFKWLHYEEGHDTLASKRAYLNAPFFLVRGVGFFLLWILFARFFVGKSLAQDMQKHTESVTAKMRRFAPGFIILFAFTGSFASFDWLMSLDPHWFSTVFGVYIFGGMVATALAAITIMVVWLRSTGRLGQGVVSNEHLYSLGTLMFAFTCFWAYIWMSQYMLIWYGNMPEETIYFFKRGMIGPNWSSPSVWSQVSLLLVVVRFILPFGLLLSRNSKTNPRRLVIASSVILVGQLVDLYWMIMPEMPAHIPVFQLSTLGPPLLMVGLLILYISRFIARHRCVPVGDPLFDRSCKFHL